MSKDKDNKMDTMFDIINYEKLYYKAINKKYQRIKRENKNKSCDLNRCNDN